MELLIFESFIFFQFSFYVFAYILIFTFFKSVLINFKEFVETIRLKRLFLSAKHSEQFVLKIFQVILNKFRLIVFS